MHPFATLVLIFGLAPYAHSAQVVGDLLDGSQGPAGCEVSDYPPLFWSTERGSPKSESGRPEFNVYQLYACPSIRDVKRLVLWRVRPQSNRWQLVGVSELPPNSVRKARALAPKKGKPYLNLAAGHCSVSEDSAVVSEDAAELVNAIVPGQTEALDEVAPRRVVFAWKVNAANMSMEQVPEKSLFRCYGG